MRTRTKRIIAAVLGVALAVIVGLGLAVYVVFNPTDCYDHAEVGRLDEEAIEDFRPAGTELTDPGRGPTCDWIEPRWKASERTWTYRVVDGSDGRSARSAIVRAAERDGWRADRRPLDEVWADLADGEAPAPEESDPVLTKLLDTGPALLVITTRVTDAAGATDDDPVGTVRLRVTTQTGHAEP